MARNRQRGGRNGWVRPVDWDGAEFTTTQSELAGITGTWLRVPSDNIDPLTDHFIGPKTLIRTLVRGMLIISAELANGVFPVYYHGIIAWDGPDPNGPPAQLPDPSNLSLDWIWHGGTWVTGATESGGGGYESATAIYGGETGWSESQAMRKLPPGKGILWVGSFFDNSPTGHLVARLNMGVRMALKGDVSASGLGGG